MKTQCEEVRESMPDLAAGLAEPSAAVQEHLRGCAGCAGQLQEFRQTMALMDEWEAPEPSQYFDTRLMARLREEKAAEAGRGWLAWLPRLAMAAILVVAVGVGVFHFYGGAAGGDVAVNPAQNVPGQVVPEAERGTAVGDLQTLDSDNELYADFDVLDDVDSTQNQAATTN